MLIRNWTILHIANWFYGKTSTFFYFSTTTLRFSDQRLPRLRILLDGAFWRQAAFKVQVARFGWIMKAFFARVTGSFPFSVRAFGSSVYRFLFGGYGFWSDGCAAAVLLARFRVFLFCVVVGWGELYFFCLCLLFSLCNYLLVLGCLVWLLMNVLLTKKDVAGVILIGIWFSKYLMIPLSLWCGSPCRFEQCLKKNSRYIYFLYFEQIKFK